MAIDASHQDVILRLFQEEHIASEVHGQPDHVGYVPRSADVLHAEQLSQAPGTNQPSFMTPTSLIPDCYAAADTAVETSRAAAAAPDMADLPAKPSRIQGRMPSFPSPCQSVLGRHSGQHAAARPHSKRPRVCLQYDVTENGPAAKRLCQQESDHISKPSPMPHTPKAKQAPVPAVDVSAPSPSVQTGSRRPPVKKAPSVPGRITKLREKMDKTAKRRAASKQRTAASVNRHMGARQHNVPQPCEIFATDDRPSSRPSQAAHQPASGLLKHAASLQASSARAYQTTSTQSRAAPSTSQPAAKPVLHATSASRMEQADPVPKTQQRLSRHAPGKRTVQTLGKQAGIDLLAAQHAKARSATGTSPTSINMTQKSATASTHSSQPAEPGSNKFVSFPNRKRALETLAEHVQPPRKLPRAIPWPTCALPPQMALATGEVSSSACIVLGRARSLQTMHGGAVNTHDPSFSTSYRSSGMVQECLTVNPHNLLLLRSCCMVSSLDKHCTPCALKIHLRAS